MKTGRDFYLIDSQWFFLALILFFIKAHVNELVGVFA